MQGEDLSDSEKPIRKSEKSIGLAASARFRTSAARREARDSTTVRAQERMAQNLASNFLGRLTLARVHIEAPRRGAHQYFIAGRQTCSFTHAGFENRNDVIAPNRSATRSDLLAALLLSAVLEEEILSRGADLEGQGHFNPPTFEVTFSNRKKREEEETKETTTTTTTL